MEYKQLQKLAKKLGLPFIGVPTEELKRSINEKQDKAVENPSNPDNRRTTDDVQTKVSENINTAIIISGVREIRRYSKDIHGDSFMEKANEFAKSGGYTIKAIDLAALHICSACGHKDYK